MEKTILVVRRSKFGSSQANYYVEKSASTLQEATEYLVALKTLNKDKEITYILYNEFGQFDVEEKKAEEKKNEVNNEITF